MFTFLSRKETAPRPDRLVPYGFAREARQFHDDLAWYEQERARIDGRGFGRRSAPPEKQKLARKAPAERVRYFADESRKTLHAHPASLFRR